MCVNWSAWAAEPQREMEDDLPAQIKAGQKKKVHIEVLLCLFFRNNKKYKRHLSQSTQGTTEHHFGPSVEPQMHKRFAPVDPFPFRLLHVVNIKAPLFLLLRIRGLLPEAQQKTKL